MEETDKFYSKTDLPFLEMEFQLYHKKDVISTKVDQETQSNYEDNFEKEPGSIYVTITFYVIIPFFSQFINFEKLN